MFTDPPWRRRGMVCCHACQTVFLFYPVREVITCTDDCPLCYQRGASLRLSYNYFRWKSQAVWWQPWTWGSGYFTQCDTGRKYKAL
jgi:hypothetical protein